MGTFLVIHSKMQAHDLNNPDGIVLDVMKRHSIVELGASGCQGCDPCCCCCIAGNASRKAQKNIENGDMIRAMDAVDESISAGIKSMLVRAIFISFIVFAYFVMIITIINGLGRDSSGENSEESWW